MDITLTHSFLTEYFLNVNTETRIFCSAALKQYVYCEWSYTNKLQLNWTDCVNCMLRHMPTYTSNLNVPLHLQTNTPLIWKKQTFVCLPQDSWNLTCKEACFRPQPKVHHTYTQTYLCKRSWHTRVPTNTLSITSNIPPQPSSSCYKIQDHRK